MVKFLLSLVLLFIAAKLVGEVIRFLRQVFSPPRPNDGVARKESRRQFDNVEDADYEDISEKK